MHDLFKLIFVASLQNLIVPFVVSPSSFSNQAYIGAPAATPTFCDVLGTSSNLKPGVSSHFIEVTFVSFELSDSSPANTFIVLLNKNGSCLIIDIFFLNDSSVKSLIFIPSIVINPFSVSNTLVSKLNIVDLPCPLFPTMQFFY